MNPKKYNHFIPTMSVITILLLFPVYFYYDSLVGFKIIPPVFGGYFTLISGVVFFPMLYAFKYHLDNNKTQIKTIDKIFFSILALILLISIINFFLEKPRSSYNELLVWSTSGVLFNLICYFLAKTLPIQAEKFKTLLIISMTTMILIVLYNIGDSGIFYLKESAQNSESIASYQGSARSLVVIGLLLISMIKSKKITLPIFLIILTTLFFNGARTEFVLFFFSYISLLIYTSIKSRKQFALVVITLTLLSVIISTSFNNLINYLPENRMMELLDVKSSNSGQIRLKSTMNAIDTIIKKPILGDYGSYAKNEEIGNYSHNLLSAWVNLGLVGFTLYVFALLIIIINTFSRLPNKKSEKTITRVSFVFSAFTILALLLSKDYSYMLFGFMIGFYSKNEESANITKNKLANNEEQN